VRHLFSTVWDDVRQGATQPARWNAPPSKRPVRQFFHGLLLPFHLLRVLWQDPVARRRYLRVGILQSVAVIALALTCHGTGKRADDAAGRRVAVAEGAMPVEDLKEEERESFKLAIKSAAEELRREAIARSGAQDKAAPGESAEALARDKERAPENFWEELKRVLERVKDLASTSEVQFWISLLAAMQVAQWVVIALSREYHDAIGRDLSLLTAIEPEDGPLTPRPRVDMKWLRNRVRRYLRGLWVLLAGLPVIYALTAPFSFRQTLLSVLIPLWSAYWVVVFTAAKSAYAWKDSAAGEPWFLRGWNWLTTRVPGFRWGFLQRYGQFWANRTREVFPPAAEMEKQPWAFSGLAVVRMLSELPLLKCFLRPLIPVASAHLLVARSAADLSKPPELSAPPAAPPGNSSAAAA
jgi:hypothetical protein